MSGRPHAQGLSYFSMDVEFFNDRKILELMEIHPIIGPMFYIQLLMAIYKAGNYIKWDRITLITFKRNNGYTDNELLNQMLETILSLDLLDRDLYTKYSILTSFGIQERYLMATKRREQVIYIKEYMLIDLSTFKTLPQSISIASINSKEIQKIVKVPDPKYRPKANRVNKTEPTIIPSLKNSPEKIPEPVKAIAVVAPINGSKIYRDEEFERIVFDTFDFDEIKHQVNKSLLCRCMAYLKQRDQLEFFKEQFYAFSAYQTLTNKQFLNNFGKFIGKESSDFLDGEWSLDNWQEKLKREQNKSIKKSNGNQNRRGYTPEGGYGQI